MAIDSSANLLFNISANPSEAQDNIARFRGLLSKDLGAMGAEFRDWSTKVFGNLTTISGGFTALGAAVAAGTVAAFSVMNAAGEKWVSYVSEIAKASRVTGIGVEDMSRLAEAAEMTGVPLDAVTRGLGFLYKNISLANQGSEKQIEMFRRQGIGARELAEAEKNPLPILMRLADAFHDNASAVQKAGIGREEFGRGWADLLPMLSRGSAAIREMGDTINGTSKIVTDKAVVSIREYKIAVRELKEQHEALDYTIGTESMPVLMQWAVGQATAAKMAVEAWRSPMDTLGKMMVANAKGVVSMGLWPLAEFALGFRTEMAKMEADAKRLAKLGTEKPTGEFLPPETKKTTQEFYGLSSIVETLRGQMAGLEGDEAKVYQQAQHFRFELQKAEDALFELGAKSKLKPETFAREFAAMKDLPKMILGFSEAVIQDLTERRDLSVLSATAELENKLIGLREQSYQNQVRAAERERQLTISKLELEKRDSEQNLTLVEEIHSAALAKIGRERITAFSGVLQGLQSDLAAMVTARQTTAERIAWVYDQDLARFSRVSEAEKLKDITDLQEREIVHQQFEMNRAAALDRHNQDLTVLQNSQGWQGVFGDYFAQHIRGNEELLRDWQTSGDQAMLMTRVAMEALGDQSRKAFGMMAQGMGQAIAQAVIYKKSVGEAMREALAQTLASIGAECLVMAIYSTALGFIRLAQGHWSAAAEAFTAASYFGAGSAAALVAGRAVAPKQGGAGGAGGAGEGVSGGGSAAASSQAGEARRPQVNIYIQGNIVGRYGIDELAEMLNDAVRSRDVKLISSGTLNNTRLLL